MNNNFKITNNHRKYIKNMSVTSDIIVNQNSMVCDIMVIHIYLQLQVENNRIWNMTV